MNGLLKLAPGEEPVGWPWPNFTPAELRCRHCNYLAIDRDFMDRLQLLRDRYGKPLPVTSGYRCAVHNQAVSSTGPTGPHTTGRAVDLSVARGEAWRVLVLAGPLGFTGLGVQQRGANRFLHLDDLPETGPHPRPMVWSYG